MPVLTLEKTSSPASLPAASRRLINIARQPLRMPKWAVGLAVLLVACAAFVVGRHKPAHHYVAYFGYPMVLDTTTGKACYAAPPKASDSMAQDAAFAIDGNSDTQAAKGPDLPMCGNE